MKEEYHTRFAAIFANYLPTKKVNIFQQSYCHHFEFDKQGKEYQLVFHYVDTNVNGTDPLD
jgi:hypothetical protein